MSALFLEQFCVPSSRYGRRDSLQVAGTSTLHTHRGSPHSPGHAITRCSTTAAVRPSHSPRPDSESLAAARRHSQRPAATNRSSRHSESPGHGPRSPTASARVTRTLAAARRHLPRPGAGVTRRGPSHSPRSAITHRGSPHSRWPESQRSCKSPRPDEWRRPEWEASHGLETSTWLQ